MKFKKSLIFLAAITLFTSGIASFSNTFRGVSADGETYVSKTANIGDYVSIESSGAPFYISFNKFQDIGETARFSYVIDEFVISDDDLKNNAGFFLSTKDNIASGNKTASGTYFKSFNDIINDDIGASPSTVEEVKRSCFKEKILSSILPVKDGSNVNVIVRDGVNDYSQVTLGNEFVDGNITDGCCYGYYFDGANVKMSFLFDFLYGKESITIYYQDGVSVNIDNTTVAPTVDSDSYSIRLYDDKSDWTPGSLPLFNASLSYIPFTKNAVETGLIVEYDHIEVNDETRQDISFVTDGSYYYVVCKLASNDTLKIVSSSKVGKEDASNVKIHDLYDVSNQTKITFDGKTYYGKDNNGTVGIGNIANTVNNAFRFNLTYTASELHSYSRIGIWTSNNRLWSNFGYIIRFGPEQNVFILSGEEVEYAKGKNEQVIPDSKFSVVIGLCKIFDENDVWYANRIYVDINGVRTVEYNDYDRRALGSAIIADYFDDSICKAVFEDYRINNLVTVNNENNEHVHTNNASYTLKGESFEAKYSLDDGYKFETFKCNGVDVLSDLKFDNGLYTYKIDEVTSSLNFTYTLLENVSVKLSLDGNFIDTNYEDNPLYGSRPTISFTLINGKYPTSIKVNNIEKIQSLYRKGNVYYLDLESLTADTEVVVVSEDKTFTPTYKSATTSYVSVSFENNAIPVGGSTAINIAVEYGYYIDQVSIEGDATLSTYKGSYFLEDVYSDVTVTVVTKKKEELIIEPVKQFDWATLISAIIYSVSGVVFVTLLITALVARKKAKK